MHYISGPLKVIKMYYVMSMNKAKCLLSGRLDGKTVLITGANSGIGLETTAELARRGAHIIMACRNHRRAETARNYILEYYGEGQPTVMTRNVANPTAAKSLGPVNPEQVFLLLI